MDVAQLVEPRVVIPVVVGSSPIVHPRSLAQPAKGPQAAVRLHRRFAGGRRSDVR